MQVKRDCTNQAFLFGVIDGAGRIYKAASAPIADLEEYESLTFLSDEINLAAAIVDVALNNPDAPTGEVTGCNALEVVTQGFVPSMATVFLRWCYSLRGGASS